MKTIKNFKSVILVIMFLANLSFAETPSFKVNVSNINYTSKNTLEFDIYLLNGNNENSKQEELRYSLGQYFFEFNPKIANGGNLNYTIVDSDLPEAMRPRNASVKENQLRLFVNSVSADKKNLPVFNNKSPGLLIARMKLETSADKFADIPLDLKLSESKFKTKVFSFDGKKNIELVNSDDNSIEGITGKLSNESITNIPAEFALGQNYPNPFNPSTTINYELPASNFVTLKIYDLVGKEVMTLVNEKLDAGRYSATFNGSNLASGMYFYKISAGEFTFVRKMVLIK
ncbi:MAG: T9SS type A sorting domain-containing protein [Ignavibacteria bacterium]|nr:T9SS type A sorting domain-containing protein [Ignavibacteria bacterium]